MPQALSQIVLYMIENLNLAPSTLHDYVLAIKSMHKYRRVSTDAFEDKRLWDLVEGYYEIKRDTTSEVMSWSKLRHFGRELTSDKSLCYEDKKAVWTAVLFAYWGPIRFGDFLPRYSLGYSDISIIKKYVFLLLC